MESIALKDPKERTRMFELISQSREFAAEYDKKKEALLKAREDTQFHFNKKKSATVERKHVSQEKLEVRLHIMFPSAQPRKLIYPQPQRHHIFNCQLYS